MFMILSSLALKSCSLCINPSLHTLKCELGDSFHSCACSGVCHELSHLALIRLAAVMSLPTISIRIVQQVLQYFLIELNIVIILYWIGLYCYHMAKIQCLAHMMTPETLPFVEEDHEI